MVGGEARLYGKARAFGNSQISDKACLHGCASIGGEALVYGEAEIGGEVEVSGWAAIFGEAFLCGSRKIEYGEYYKNNLKWEVKSKTVSTAEESWSLIHQQGYEDSVWSVADDSKLHRKIIHLLLERFPPKKLKILFPGCGSGIEIQNTIFDYLEARIDRIVCTDFSDVIKIAKERQEQLKNQNKIEYLASNSSTLSHTVLDTKLYDTIIAINSVLSENDRENRAILQSCSDVMDSEGIFIGLFPTPFCALEIGMLEGNINRLKSVDLEKSSVYDASQKMNQTFYTPLRLKRLFKEVGLEIEIIEIFICDTENMVSKSRKHYGIEDEDIFVYEYFIVAKKSRG